jgi:2-(1,2-epoxy-1,2-dihydrophenyl)acetyl-CoA isomerase
VAGFAKHLNDVRTIVGPMTMYLHTAISRLAWMRAPVIAAVNGIAAGAGLSLVAACDLAVAADTAGFTSAYTKIGLTPDGSSTYFLPRLIGHRRAMELYLTNRRLSAAEALEWGLINRIVPAKELRQEVKTMAERIAKGPTLAHLGVKKLMQMSSNDTLESQMEREARCIMEMGGSRDGREGIQAFVDKRSPNFIGE